jgi:hypothetical protein
MRAPRRLLLRAALVVLATGLGLGLGEAAARLLVPSRPVFDLRGLHQLRPDRGWLYGLRPGAEGRIPETGDALYRINSDGFRGPAHARPKPAGRLRVLVMGDSVAFGYGVAEADAFPRILERELAARVPELDVEVVNLGVGGYNAWNEEELLKDVGVGYQPDLVLVQFCINDLNDPSMHFDAQTRLALSSIPDAAFPDPSRRRAPSRAASVLTRICARSQLCALGRDLWLASRAPSFDDADRRAAFAPVEGDGGPEWRWLESRYTEMAAVAAAAGARFAVLAVPYPAQVARRGPDAVEERLLGLARRRGWTLVDPLSAFRAAHAAGTPLFLDWWHPTAAGHRIAAEEALRALACAGDLGEKARRACPAGSRGHAAGE